MTKSRYAGQRNRVGGKRIVRLPTSHITVRTDRYTAVQPHSAFTNKLATGREVKASRLCELFICKGAHQHGAASQPPVAQSGIAPLISLVGWYSLLSQIDIVNTWVACIYFLYHIMWRGQAFTSERMCFWPYWRLNSLGAVWKSAAVTTIVKMPSGIQ